MVEGQTEETSQLAPNKEPAPSSQQSKTQDTSFQQEKVRRTRVTWPNSFLFAQAKATGDAAGEFTDLGAVTKKHRD